MIELKKHCSNEPTFRLRNHTSGGQSIDVHVNDKKFIEYLLIDVGIINKNKSFNAFIPKQFLDWEHSKHVLRGLFESDGSLYFSKSKVGGYPTYPRLEFKTNSKRLGDQILNILKRNAFITHKRPNRSGGSTNIYLSGDAMLEKWMREIGFSSKKNMTKYNLYKKLGHYIPKISFRDRSELLHKGGCPNPVK